MPNSAATWVNGLPPRSSKATASRLNSAVKSRLVLLILSTFQPPQERIKGVHQCEGGSFLIYSLERTFRLPPKAALSLPRPRVRFREAV